MHRLMHNLAKLMAFLGGLMLITLILLTCLSVIGRGLNGLLHGMLGQAIPEFAQKLLDIGVGPINGDFELVEAGIAFSIFAFLPLCQLTMNHASVDIFTASLSARNNRILGMIIEIVFAIVLIVIAYQLYQGLSSKMRYGETTFLIQFPVWWSYAISLIGAVAAAIVGVYMAIVHIMECFTGREILDPNLEFKS